MCSLRVPYQEAANAARGSPSLRLVAPGWPRSDLPFQGDDGYGCWQRVKWPHEDGWHWQMAVLVPHVEINFKKKIAKCFYWHYRYLVGIGNVQFIHLLPRPGSFQHLEGCVSCERAPTRWAQGPEVIPIVGTRFFLHKNHRICYLKANWERVHKNEAITKWWFLPLPSFPELWKDSHFTESICYSMTALGVLGPLH